jgi:osmoprotectant transport system permease protein
MRYLAFVLIVVAAVFGVRAIVLTADETSGQTGVGGPVKVGSKKFTENIVLGEIITQMILTDGVQAEHRRGLGGTRILWNGLLKAEIDIYPEYTGTIQREILDKYSPRNIDEMRERLSEFGIEMSLPLGFNNTYAIGMKEDVAEEYGIEKISDLRDHPELKFGFTNEFMDREDGWEGLKSRYGLPQADVRGLDHDLAYRGIASGSIDVTDLYSTDAEIEYYNLRTLEDDLNYFPLYEAVLLYREDLAGRVPNLAARLEMLEGTIPEDIMTKMNAQAKLDGMHEKEVAEEFLAETYRIEVEIEQAGFLQRLRKNTVDHLILVLISLSAAILIAIPLGILAVRFPGFGKVILAIVGILQTIPSLALLVFMIPLLGIGGPPAVMALFLYSLLPIVRNTYTGIHDIPSPITDSARALGLKPSSRLRLVELPIASSTILAGIKTSAVINIGTATIGALIGAGGYGQPILTGIRLDDIGLILEGAVPAALMAIGAQWLFDLSEKLVVPKGLRL